LEGLIFNIQRFSLDDGPGVRTTIFFKGCPLRCLWCSNPESQNIKPEIIHRNSMCNKCSRCVEICPEKSITLDTNGIHINRKLCTACGKCTQVCVPEALMLFGTPMSVEEVLSEIRKDAQYYQSSGGGVTLSGGEPLSQPEFARSLLLRCKNEGFHTCVETTGYASTDVLETVLEQSSLVLFDIKVVDPIIHENLTNRSNSLIIHNLERITLKGIPVIIRVPLIPTLNDSDEQLKAFAQKAKDLGIKQIHILPYHKFGITKYQQLDREYKLNDLNRPDSEKLLKAKINVESLGIGCEIVG
jgi:pyruvate formate lyase activating enzyme